MTPSNVTPWTWFADADPSIFADLDDLQCALLLHDLEFMRRPDQGAPHDRWKVLGLIAGRGWGKSWYLANLINQGVEQGMYRDLAFLAQDDERTYTNQVQPIIAHSPPWFRASMVGGRVMWPNGVTATLYTPESPGKIRGGNHDLAWCSEIVGWHPATAIDSWDNISTATRVGRARIVYDTTSKGRNELIAKLAKLNEFDSVKYPIIRGSMFANATLDKDYIQRTVMQYAGRRYEEEVNGAVFTETDGSIFEQRDIDAARVEDAPVLPVILVGSDPAITERAGSDETGIIVGGKDARGHVYILRDLTGKHTPEQHGELMFREYQAGAAGAVVETNRGGSYITAAIRATFSNHRIGVEVVESNRPMPRRSKNTFFIREVHARGAKNSAERAGGPSALYKQGRVHHVETFASLEAELCTFEPGSRESPNRYDAAMHLITELSGIKSERVSDEQRQQSAKGTAAASAELRGRLRALGSGRSVL